MESTLVLPYPPSVNSYWRNVGGRTLISKDGRAYRERVVDACKAQDAMLYGEDQVELFYLVNPPDEKLRDLDNVDKSLWDSLVYAGVLDNDWQIRRRISEFGPMMKLGRVTLTIRTLASTDRARR